MENLTEITTPSIHDKNNLEKIPVRTDIDVKRKLIAYSAIEGKPMSEVGSKIIKDFFNKMGENENRNLLAFYYDMEPSEMKRYRKFKVNKAGGNLTHLFELVKELIIMVNNPLTSLDNLKDKIMKLEPCLNRLTSIYSQKKLEL